MGWGLGIYYNYKIQINVFRNYNLVNYLSITIFKHFFDVKISDSLIY